MPNLQEKLKKGEYQPKPVQRVWIPKMGSKELRPLGIPPVENRVVEMALRNVIEPIFENEFAEHSYGFRFKRGAKDALRRVVQLLQKGKCWVVDADIKGYPTKTRIVNENDRGGFDFPGYHFERGYRWPRQKSLEKFKETIRSKTPRLRPGGMEQIIQDVNRTLTGWCGYFKHSHRTTFEPLDQWIGQRLRSILRKRHKGKGRARGNDHQRWPNAYFVAFGLISLALTRTQAANSP